MMKSTSLFVTVTKEKNEICTALSKAMVEIKGPKNLSLFPGELLILDFNIEKFKVRFVIKIY